MKKRTPSASISFKGAIGSSPGASLASTTEKDWSRKRPVVLLSSIAMRAPATKSSAGGMSRIEIVSRECASWMTPTLTASGSACAGGASVASRASVAAKSALNAETTEAAARALQRSVSVAEGAAGRTIFARNVDHPAGQTLLHRCPRECRRFVRCEAAAHASAPRATGPRGPRNSSLQQTSMEISRRVRTPTSGRSHATRIARRIGRPCNHPPRVYRGVHRRRKRPPEIA